MLVADKQLYIGRFAPSPTGPLHFGSLYTALASFLDARSQQGRWRLRIDDLDTPRNKTGSVASILSTLDAFGLHWDDSIAYQSQTLDSYALAIEQLAKDQLFYPCTCSRKTLTENLPCLCRNNPATPAEPYALRLTAQATPITFYDGLQGLCTQLSAESGDFVVKRKDHIIAYQFAVVIDDHLQQVTRVVRGCDLLEATPRQIYVHQLLALPIPEYLHVPIIVDAQGYKLSKQTLATAVDTQRVSEVLFELLVLLRQGPPDELRHAPAAELLSWAIAHWQPGALANCRAIARPDADG